MRVVALADIAVDLPDPYPRLVLREVDEPRREVRIPIGQPEAVAIAHAWKGVATPRPLTHELFATCLERFDVRVEVVEVTSVQGRSFGAQVTLVSGARSEVVACRPSDGVALALRQRPPAPILVDDAVLAAAGTRPS
jgi:bifunctional DNase/RNase